MALFSHWVNLWIWEDWLGTGAPPPPPTAMITETGIVMTDETGVTMVTE